MARNDSYPRPSWSRGWLYWGVGIGSLLWLLLRSVPNPRRLSYPCQQAALASSLSMLAYAASLLGVTHFLHYLRRHGALLGGIAGSCFASLLVVVFITGEMASSYAVFKNLDLPAWTSSSAVSNVYVVPQVPVPECSLDAGVLPM